jgi:RNA polymerase-binding transcription factor DksA
MQVEPDDATLAAAEAEVADVEHALGRLDEGSYGTCEACGGPIDAERLASTPAARSCAAHAQTV